MDAYSDLFTDVLSKVKADDVGVVSLMDCVFVKTDIGAKMTRGNTGSDACMYPLSQRTGNEWNKQMIYRLYKC